VARTCTVCWPQLTSEIESLCELARQQRTAKSAPEEMPETDVPPVAPSLGRGGSATGAVASPVSAAAWCSDPTGDSKMYPSVVVSRPVPPLANAADNTANTHTAFIAALVSRACAPVRGSRTLDVTPAKLFTESSHDHQFHLRKFTTFESLLSPPQCRLHVPVETMPLSPLLNAPASGGGDSVGGGRKLTCCAYSSCGKDGASRCGRCKQVRVKAQFHSATFMHYFQKLLRDA
jgi:hypothetical protein